MSAELNAVEQETLPSGRLILNVFVAILSIFLVIGALGYVWYFYHDLDTGDWMEVHGFSRILIPDVFLYISLVGSIDDLDILQLAVAGVKNAFGPVLMWKLGGESWYQMALVNCALVVATAIYLLKLADHFAVDIGNKAKIVLTLIALPAMIYYSVGPAKELPQLLAITAFFYHFVKRQRFMTFVMAALAILFRYQLIAVIVPFVFVAKRSKNPVRTAVHLMVIAAAIYPLIAKVGITAPGETENFRQGSEEQTGALIEKIRNEIPIVSAAAVGIRVVQSVLEPVVNVLRSDGIYSDGYISVINVVYLLSLLPVLPYWYRAGRHVIHLYKEKRPMSRDLLALYTFLVLFVVPVGGFSFVHHRYLFPITALLLLAGYESVRTAERRRDNNRHAINHA